jgi:hypothetical protein
MSASVRRILSRNAARSYMSIHPGEIPSEAKAFTRGNFYVDFFNTGKVYAKDFSADATMQRFYLAGYRPRGYPQKRTVHRNQLRPAGEGQAPGIPPRVGDIAFLYFDPDIFTDQDLNLLRNGGEAVEIDGHLNL